MSKQIPFCFWLCALLGVWVLQHGECTDVSTIPNAKKILAISEPSPTNILTECGQTIYADNGTIEYKLDKFYDADELCAFIIRFESYGFTESHIFRLEADGISDSDPNAISVSDLSNSYHLGPPNVAHSVRINGYKAVVVFKTRTNTGTGFRLTFETDVTNDYHIGGVEAVYNTEDPFSLQLNFTDYDAGNLFVITSGSRMITQPGKYIRLMASAVLSNSLPVCNRLVRIYKFENYDIDWAADICEDHKGVVLETKEMFVVFFNGNSVASREVRGFFQWETVTH